MVNINVSKLGKELRAVGINNGGCNSNGIVWGEDGVTEIQNRADVAAVVSTHDPTPIIPTTQVFELPIIASTVTASDFIVQSPKPKKNHLEAHAEAVVESKKADKSLALMVLDMVVYIEELEKRIKILEKK